jgi:hypothetical protein
MLTHASLEMTVGNLRLLQVDLPRADDQLWTVLVNGKEVSISRRDHHYFVPLEEQAGDRVTTVDLVYAGSALSTFWRAGWRFVAPKVGLPMRDIAWDLYVPAGFEYSGFGGAMQPDPAAAPCTAQFNAAQYLEWNREQRERSLLKAREVLDAGEELVKTGQQREARKAFEQALTYSLGQADLNEDARVQLRNLTRQQLKIGLVNRRDAVRLSRNIVDEQQVGQMAGFQDGEFTQEYAERVERALSEKDNQALSVVAEKIIEQQAAAAGVISSIRVSMPEDGRRLRFARDLLVDPGEDLDVSVRVSRGRLARAARAAWPYALVFFGAWALLARAAGDAGRR